MEAGIFCARHTSGCQLSQYPHIHLAVIRGGPEQSGAFSSLRSTSWRGSDAVRSFACCATAMA
ncbi:transposase [Salmonella enterica]|nr:transposase [Salmonella enterica]